MYFVMKNITKLSMLALAMFTAACAQVEDPTEPQNPSGDNVVVFEANVPTKTSISDDDKTVTWVAGDEVKFVWAGGEVTATASASGASTTFSVELPEEVNEVYAVYPSTISASVADGNIVLNFSNEWSGGEFKDADICVAKTLKSAGTWNKTLNFKNAACLLKVGVSGNEIKHVQIAAVGDEIISGDLAVTFEDNGDLTFTYPETGKTTVNMNVTGPGNYYIPVFPDVKLTEGFRVNCFVPGEEEETQLTPFYYNGTFTTGRGKVIILSEIESRLGQYYVTPNGAGSKAGQSWANAMDVEAFKSFVTNPDNFFLLRGAVFHFSAEEFSFGDNYLELNYSDHSTVNFTLEGTISGSSMTVFKGRSNTSENKAGVLWPQANTDLTVKNVKFTGTDGISNSAAVRINNGAQKVTFENCVFENNKTAGNGACVNLYNSAELVVKGCKFVGNAGEGAALYIENDNTNVRVENTIIKESGKKSNAIRIKKAAKFELIDSEISDNYSYATIYTTDDFVGTFRAERTVWKKNHANDDLGAAGWYQSATTYEFIDCEFIDNQADWGGGALMFVGAHAKIEGCTFQGNHADGADNTSAAGGAIYAKGEGVTIDCKDVLFKDNYNFVGDNTQSGGIIRVKQAGGIARFDNCVFDGNYTNRSVEDNAAAAAIINCRTGGVKYYFNACEFKNNTSGKSTSGNEQGGTKGTVIASYRASTIALNNCSMHDNYGARNTDNLSWIYVDNADNTLLISNSTIVGDPTIYGGERKNDWGVIKLHTHGNYYMINNIICSNVEGGQSIWCEKGDTEIFSYYNKTNPDLDERIIWGTDTGSGHDYWASSNCFGGWSAPYIWNGTLTGTNSNMKAATADVNTQLQNSDSDFYTWLSSIGALGKDINGNSRGTTSWPGCYQAN